MPDIVDMDKLCSGCLTYEEYLKKPDGCLACTGYLTKDINCPCIHCLIKMMCDKVCEDLSKTSWWYEYSSNRKYNDEYE